ncbi:hypothetical protein [Azonexus hydrophilus]|uniref:hypothetical protein n=1 Tax=Azonexus hydrophilus TaxID=418702 RepID=UPI00248FF52B|nr:hypothetical protein [Azonexus hydrophilus]
MRILDMIKGLFTVREAAGQTIDDDEEGWRRLTGDTDRDLAPVTLRRSREISAWLWQANLMANRIIELPLAYLLADGVKLEVNDPDAQAMLNRFWNDPINSMDLKLEKKVRELALFGEQCYPAFVNDHSGHVRLGYLDPALIETVVTDPDNPEQPIGIVTVKDKKGGARRYRVIVNGDEDDLFSARTREIRDTFDDGNAFYFNINGLSSGARGRPDLLASADWLDAYDDFLFGEVDRNRYLRAFVWDVTIKGANEEAVKQRARDIEAPAPNSVRVHNDSEVWAAVTPDIKSADTSESARLLRNHVLGGATLPEHWYGGGGDVNRSTGESMGDPAFKMMSMRQRTIKYMLEQIARFAIRQWAQANQKAIDFGDGDFLPSAVFPEMIARDTTRYAAALQQVIAGAAHAVSNGFISKKLALRLIATVASQLGVEIDIDEALQEAIAAEQTEKGKDVFPDPLEK